MPAIIDESVARVLRRLRWPGVWLARETERAPAWSTYAVLDAIVLVGGRPVVLSRHLVAVPHDDDGQLVDLLVPTAVADVRALVGPEHDVLGLKGSEKAMTSLERRARLRAGEQLGPCEWLADWVAALDLPCADDLLAPPVGVGHGLAARLRRASRPRGPT